MRTFVHVQNFFFGPAFSSDHRRLPTMTAFTSFHTKLFWHNSSDHGRLPTSWCDGAFKHGTFLILIIWYIMFFDMLFDFFSSQNFKGGGALVSTIDAPPLVCVCVCVCGVCVCVCVVFVCVQWESKSLFRLFTDFCL